MGGDARCWWMHHGWCDGWMDAEIVRHRPLNFSTSSVSALAGQARRQYRWRQNSEKCWKILSYIAIEEGSLGSYLPNTSQRVRGTAFLLTYILSTERGEKSPVCLKEREGGWDTIWVSSPAVALLFWATTPATENTMISSEWNRMLLKMNSNEHTSDNLFRCIQTS